MEARFADVHECEDPDLIVAMGCALAHAKILEAKGTAVHTLDGKPVASLPGGSFSTCSAFSLGCKAFVAKSGAFEFIEMILKNSVLPASHTEVFGLKEKGQTQVDVYVLQGEHGQHPDDCLHIDTLHLTGLPPGRGDGDPRIEVKYEYQADGLVVVTATDTESGKSVTSDITRYIQAPTA